MGRLKWYDKNARDLPWRIPPKLSRAGVKPDLYHIWLSEIMLQQTSVKTASTYYELFLLKWPTVLDLATAQPELILEAWAGLGYYRRAHNLIRCAKIIVEDHHGVFPMDKKTLSNLPGIGAYTSAAILAIGHHKKANVIDGNISRIISRLFAIDTPIPLSTKLIQKYSEGLLPRTRFGDYAQALMDLGSLICTAKNPKCLSCPLAKVCKTKIMGLSNVIPYPMLKKPKPIRYGYAFVTLVKKKDILLERRPKDSLLCGMLCFPISVWKDPDNMGFIPPFEANWNILNKSVTHVFSHFTLKLKIAQAKIKYAPSGYIKKSLETFNPNSMPSLMRKVF